MNDIVYEEQKQIIEMWKNKYYEQKEEKAELNNKINSIFSNFEQFINSYKNNNLDDFFIVLRLSELVEFYNDLKEVIKSNNVRTTNKTIL